MKSEQVALKVLVIEDNVYKYIDIQRALNALRINDIIQVESYEEAIEKIEEKKDVLSFIVTDMSYPMKKREAENEKAGEKLLEYVKQQNLNIPVIVCSSIRYQYPEAYATIWYNTRMRDLNADIKEALRTLL